MLRRNTLGTLALVAVLAACDNDPESPPPVLPLGRVVVLNGQPPTGATVVADENERGVHVSFDPFDGASFALRNDTVASAASKGEGDLLFIAALATGEVDEIQMPGGSNPAGVQFVPGDAAASRVFVALRDSGAVAEVPLPAGRAPIKLHLRAGVCPVDVVISSTAKWSLDANTRCQSDYAILGPSRLVPLPAQGSADTINFPASVVSAQRAFVVGNFAYVMSSGDFFSVPGAVTRVNLATRGSTVLPLPTDRYGASFRIGENGLAYITDTPSSSPFVPRVYAVNVTTMTFAGTRVTGAQHLRLIKTGGVEAACYAATADTAGNVYCLENGNVLSTLLVFNAAGDQLRSAPAGAPAYDITLR